MPSFLVSSYSRCTWVSSTGTAVAGGLASMAGLLMASFLEACVGDWPLVRAWGTLALPHGLADLLLGGLDWLSVDTVGLFGLAHGLGRGKELLDHVARPAAGL